MKNMGRWSKIVKLIAFLWLAFGIAASGYAAVVTLDPAQIGTNGSNPVHVGDTFTVELIGDSFSQSTIGGGVDISFDPKILRLDSVGFNKSAFDFQKQVNTIDNDKGVAESILVSSILSQQSGRFTIAELFFTAVGGGTTSLGISDSTFPAPWFTADLQDISPSYVNGTVQVVPIPAAFGLFLSALGALSAFIDRRRR